MLATIEGVVLGVRTYKSERDHLTHNILRVLVDEEICDVDVTDLPNVIKYDWVTAQGDLRVFERKFSMRNAQVDVAVPGGGRGEASSAAVSAARRASDHEVEPSPGPGTMDGAGQVIAAVSDQAAQSTKSRR